MDKQSREIVVSIDASPDEIWRAITDPEMTRRYYYGTDILSTWQPGAEWTSVSGDELYLTGEIVEISAPRRLVQTFRVAGDDEAAQSDPSSTVTWDIESDGTGSRLKVVHDGLAPATFQYTEGGWEHILAGLKSVVESGSSLDQSMDAKTPGASAK